MTVQEGVDDPLFQGQADGKAAGLVVASADQGTQDGFLDGEDVLPAVGRVHGRGFESKGLGGGGKRLLDVRFASGDCSLLLRVAVLVSRALPVHSWFCLTWCAAASVAGWLVRGQGGGTGCPSPGDRFT